MKTATRVPCIINGKERFDGNPGKQVIPALHSHLLCHYTQADAAMTSEAIRGAMAAKRDWQAMSLADRSAIFLRAAALLCKPPWRYRMLAATILGQGKNVQQADLDAIAELADFWRFNTVFAQDLLLGESCGQVAAHAPGTWNRLEMRPLEGWVGAISPFNFTAIGGNLVSSPALLGNVVLWKPSSSAILSAHLTMRVLEEAGLPPGVIQFIPGHPADIIPRWLDDSDLAGIHFTGSTRVFRGLTQDVGNRIDRYRNFPRLVGETGGKNAHVVHHSADPDLVVGETVRAAFDYQGQKCSACSRLYLPQSLWPRVREGLLAAMEERKKASEDDPLRIFAPNGPVINKEAHERLSKVIKSEKIPCRVDGSRGYFIDPCLVQTDDPKSSLMQEEYFGPILTVYSYPDDKFTDILELVDETGEYGLTASMYDIDN